MTSPHRNIPPLSNSEGNAPVTAAPEPASANASAMATTRSPPPESADGVNTNSNIADSNPEGNTGENAEGGGLGHAQTVVDNDVGPSAASVEAQMVYSSFSVPTSMPQSNAFQSEALTAAGFPTDDALQYLEKPNPSAALNQFDPLNPLPQSDFVAPVMGMSGLTANMYAEDNLNGLMEQVAAEDPSLSALSILSASKALGQMRQGAMTPNAMYDALDPPPYMMDVGQQSTTVNGFASIIFGNHTYYMRTYAVVIGRDTAAAKSLLIKERREKLREEELLKAGKSASYNYSLPEEQEEMRYRNRDSRKRHRRASRKSKSNGYSSPASSKARSIMPAENLSQVQSSAGANYAIITSDSRIPVDPDSLLPDLYSCPLIALHPYRHTAKAHTKISREHLAIRFNHDTKVFEAHVQGRNGVFYGSDSQCLEQHYPLGSTITLASGFWLQISDITFQFNMHGVQHGETTVSLYPEPEEGDARNEMYVDEDGKSMSLGFDELHRRASGSVDTSDRSVHPTALSCSGQSFDEEQSPRPDFDDQEFNREQNEDNEEHSLVGIQQSPVSVRDIGNTASPEVSADIRKGEARKRGPGRPPKDGVMSNREKKLAAQKQAQAQTEAGNPLATEAPVTDALPEEPVVPTKNKVGRPRKHPLPEPSDANKPKRKYTKRKPKETTEGDVKQEGSGADNPAPAKKEKVKEPRHVSPPIVIDPANYTKEELTRPVEGYVTLLREALAAHPGGLPLPQIYKAIGKKYPYFYLPNSTLGWQSSIRHNLGQNAGFQKIDKVTFQEASKESGKGHLWRLTPNYVWGEKDNKKRGRSPPIQGQPPQMQPIYPHPQYAQKYYGPPGQVPPAGYQYGPPPPHYPPGQYAMPPPPGAPPYYAGPYHQANGPPMGLPPSLPLELAPNKPGSYSSPYAAKPPPTNEAQLNGQAQPKEGESGGNPVPSQEFAPPQASPIHQAPPSSEGFSTNQTQQPIQGISHDSVGDVKQGPSQGIPNGASGNITQGPPGEVPQNLPRAIPQAPPREWHNNFASTSQGPPQDTANIMAGNNPSPSILSSAAQNLPRKESHNHLQSHPPNASYHGLPSPMQALQPQQNSTTDRPLPPQPSQPGSPPQSSLLSGEAEMVGHDSKSLQSERPLPNDHLMTCIKKFKDTFLNSASARRNVAEMVDCAGSMVLNGKISSSITGEDGKFVDHIAASMTNMILKIPSANLGEIIAWDNANAAKKHSATPDTNHNGTQMAAAPSQQHGTPIVGDRHAKPIVEVTGQQINGVSHSHPTQNRPNVPVPRPPMMPNRSNGSPAPWVANVQSGSTPKPVADGASTPIPVANHNDRNSESAGQKRTHDEATESATDDSLASKRLKSEPTTPQLKH